WPELTRPAYSSIRFGGVPAASIRVGLSISVGMVGTLLCGQRPVVSNLNARFGHSPLRLHTAWAFAGQRQPGWRRHRRSLAEKGDARRRHSPSTETPEGFPPTPPSGCPGARVRVRLLPE